MSTKSKEEEEVEEREGDDGAVPHVIEADGSHATIAIPPKFAHMMERVGEDDPAIVIHFNPTNLSHFAAALTDNPPPDGHLLFTTVPFTASSIEADLMQYLSVNAAGGTQETAGCLIAPNTVEQSIYIGHRTVLAMFEAGNLGLDIPAAHLPLATMYVVLDGGEPAQGRRAPVAQAIPPAIQLFE